MAMSGSTGGGDDMFGWLRPWSLFAPQQLTQAILPNWALISVNESNSSAPETERRIVAQDSYGRQIGRLMDAVEALIAERKQDAPAVTAFAELAELKDRIDKVKREGAAERLDRIRQDLTMLKYDDPAEYKRQAEKLRALLDD